MKCSFDILLVKLGYREVYIYIYKCRVPMFFGKIFKGDIGFLYLAAVIYGYKMEEISTDYWMLFSLSIYK